MITTDHVSPGCVLKTNS